MAASKDAASKKPNRKPNRKLESRPVKRVVKSESPVILKGQSRQESRVTANVVKHGTAAARRKAVPVVHAEKKKAAGTGPAARKAAKKTAKAIAAKKPAPITQLQLSKSGGALATPAERSAVQRPISIPEAWPFPMGNRS